MTWLKFDYTTPEKPEVFAITSAMKWRDADLTVGKLFKVWRWFDAHTTDGCARNVSADFLDAVIGCKGFIKAMANVGWMVVESNGLRMPNFDYHTGASAKDRAQGARRSARSKDKKRDDSDDESNEKVTLEPLPESQKSHAQTVTFFDAREEKRREEKNKPKVKVLAPAAQKPADVDDGTWQSWVAHRKLKRATVSEIVVSEHRREAEKAGITLAEAMRHAETSGWQGFRADWYQRATGGVKRHRDASGNDAVIAQFLAENEKVVGYA